jgi:hypothetical protein
MVNQVQVVSILMIVNGALVSLMGLIYALMGPTMFALMRPAPPGPSGASGPGTTVTTMTTILSLIYVAIGLAVLTVGILNIVAGIRSLRFRGRTFALVALFSNLLPMFTCYCLPTSLGLMIYGLIVFFQTDVAYVFERVAAGEPAERFKHGWRPIEEEEMDEEEIEEEDADSPSTNRPTDIQLGPNEKFRKPPQEE